ncbi:Serine carboxypeptidase 3 [Savitreella phatthalungensis]
MPRLAVSGARSFRTTTCARKVNEKLKPAGAPEPLKVPGSGIQHSSELDQTHSSLATRLAGAVSSLLGRKRIYYSAYQPTMDLYVAAAAQAAQDSEKIIHKMANQFWYTTCGLPPTFQTWFQVTQLHLWLLMVRMRALERGVGHHYQQELTNHLFNDAEARLRVVYQIRDGRIVKTYMKDLLLQWNGATAAYDEALNQDDTVLAAAIWRNVFSAQEDPDPAAIALVVKHVRKNLYMLEKLTDEQMLKAQYEFQAPESP